MLREKGTKLIVSNKAFHFIFKGIAKVINVPVWASLLRVVTNSDRNDKLELATDSMYTPKGSKNTVVTTGKARFSVDSSLCLFESDTYVVESRAIYFMKQRTIRTIVCYCLMTISNTYFPMFTRLFPVLTIENECYSNFLHYYNYKWFQSTK